MTDDGMSVAIGFIQIQFQLACTSSIHGIVSNGGVGPCKIITPATGLATYGPTMTMCPNLAVPDEPTTHDARTLPTWAC